MLKGKIVVCLDLQKILAKLNTDDKSLEDSIIGAAEVQALYVEIWSCVWGVINAEYGYLETELALHCEQVSEFDLYLPLVGIEVLINDDHYINYSVPPKVNGQDCHDGPITRLEKTVKAIEELVRQHLTCFYKGPVWDISVGVFTTNGMYYQTHEADVKAQLK